MKKPRYIGIEYNGVRFLVDMQELMVDIFDPTTGDTTWTAFDNYNTGDIVFDAKDDLVKSDDYVKEVCRFCEKESE